MYTNDTRPSATLAIRLPRRGRIGSAGPLALLAEARRLIALWRERARSRAELRRLCEFHDRMLQDVGLGADDVRREMSKPFWM